MQNCRLQHQHFIFQYPYISVSQIHFKQQTAPLKASHNVLYCTLTFYYLMLKSFYPINTLLFLQTTIWTQKGLNKRIQDGRKKNQSYSHATQILDLTILAPKSYRCNKYQLSSQDKPSLIFLGIFCPFYSFSKTL